MAVITFNDGTGSVSLRGVFGAPYHRFRNFTPTTVPVGDRVTSIGTGQSARWVYRREYRVSLELPYISPRTYDGESGTTRAQRLIAHLESGGTVTVNVEDDVGTAPYTAWLAEGSSATLTLENPQDMLYTFSATLAQTATYWSALYGGVRP